MGNPGAEGKEAIKKRSYSESSFMDSPLYPEIVDVQWYGQEKVKPGTLVWTRDLKSITSMPFGDHCLSFALPRRSHLAPASARGTFIWRRRWDDLIKPWFYAYLHLWISVLPLTVVCLPCPRLRISKDTSVHIQRLWYSTQLSVLWLESRPRIRNFWPTDDYSRKLTVSFLFTLCSIFF